MECVELVRRLYELIFVAFVCRIIKRIMNGWSGLKEDGSEVVL